MHSLIDSGDGQGKKKNLRHVLGAEMPVSRPHFPELLFRFTAEAKRFLEKSCLLTAFQSHSNTAFL